MVTGATPPIPPPCTRFAWHCDACEGDNIFDINATGHASQTPATCLGAHCGHTLPVYLDTGVQRKYFRAQGQNNFQVVP